MLTPLRILACFVTAVIIAATAYLCAWLSFSNLPTDPNGVALTRRSLDMLRQEIEADKANSGAWPERLTDLRIVKEKLVQEDDNGNPVDRWGRPLQYRVEADGYELYSYGPDGPEGKRGREGYLYVGKPDPKMERPTLWAYTTSNKARLVQFACILAGLVAFPICLLEARGRPEKPATLLRFLSGIVVTAVFAVFAALFISALHAIPGGH